MADSEAAEAPAADVPAAMPAAGAEEPTIVEQAPAGDVDQPDVAETQPSQVDDDLQTLVDEIGDAPVEDAEGKAEKPDPVTEFLASDDFWNTEVEVDLGDGPEQVSVKDLSDAGMRHADYTKKTQALAAERKGVEDAVTFHKAFNDNPTEFARLLAVRAGLVEEGADPVRDVAGTKIPSPEEIESQINDAVEERFKADPRFIQAQAANARAEVNETFDAIETERNISLSPAIRQRIIDTAVRSNTSDLRMVLESELYRQSQQKALAEGKRRDAPSRPTKTPDGSVNPTAPDKVVSGIEEAMDRATAELA